MIASVWKMTEEAGHRKNPQKNGHPSGDGGCPNVQLYGVLGLRELIGDTTHHGRLYSRCRRTAVQYIVSTDPTLGGSTLKHEGRRQTERRPVYAGSRLKLFDVSGRPSLIRQPSNRNGENPPMIGGTMETAPSFEVRNAPSSYPTATTFPVDRSLRSPALAFFMHGGRRLGSWAGAPGAHPIGRFETRA